MLYIYILQCDLHAWNVHHALSLYLIIVCQPRYTTWNKITAWLKSNTKKDDMSWHLAQMFTIKKLKDNNTKSIYKNFIFVLIGYNAPQFIQACSDILVCILAFQLQSHFQYRIHCVHGGSWKILKRRKEKEWAH